MNANELNSHETLRQIVVFALGPEEYALSIGDVQEIIRYVEPRSVASDSPWIRGVISLRGRIIPVCDLAARLGVPRGEREPAKIVVVEAGPSTVGLIVDDVTEVLTVSENTSSGCAFRQTPPSIRLSRSATACSSCWRATLCSGAPSWIWPSEQMAGAAATRVVIADDSALMRSVLGSALGGAGIEVVVFASDGNEALDLRAAGPGRPLARPGDAGRDGVSVLRELAVRGLDIPVIVVSAFSSAAGIAAVDALAEGAFDVVPKPTAREEVDSFIATLGERVALAAAESARRRDPRKSTVRATARAPPPASIASWSSPARRAGRARSRRCCRGCPARWATAP